MNKNLKTRLTKIEERITPKVVLPWCFACHTHEADAKQEYINQHGHEPLQMVTFRVIEPVDKVNV